MKTVNLKEVPNPIEMYILRINVLYNTIFFSYNLKMRKNTPVADTKKVLNLLF